MNARDVILNAVGDTADEMGIKHVALVTDAILSALAAAGLKVVGREPTPKMLVAALLHADTGTAHAEELWHAMFDAADPALIEKEKQQ